MKRHFASLKEFQNVLHVYVAHYQVFFFFLWDSPKMPWVDELRTDIFYWCVIFKRLGIMDGVKAHLFSVMLITYPISGLKIILEFIYFLCYT